MSPLGGPLADAARRRAEEGAGREVDALAVPQVEHGQRPKQVAYLPARGVHAVAPQQPPEVDPAPGEAVADDGEF